MLPINFEAKSDAQNGIIKENKMAPGSGENKMLK